MALFFFFIFFTILLFGLRCVFGLVTFKKNGISKKDSYFNIIIGLDMSVHCQ